MLNQLKFLSISWLCIVVQAGYCQSGKDTAVLIKEFNKVMSFSVQPNLYYTTTTKMNSIPVIESKDTMSIKGTFYKRGNNLYYHSGEQEACVEDSLVVQIDHGRKMIWISRVDMESREKMNTAPLNNKNLQGLFQENYTISKSMIDNSIARMNFETKQERSTAGTTTEIGLEYNAKNYLPVRMDMEVKMKQEAKDEILTALKAEGINEAGLIQTIGGVKYIVRKQKISILFSGIDTSPEKVLQMPSWKDKLEYLAGGEFAGKGVYKEYEVVKTF